MKRKLLFWMAAMCLLVQSIVSVYADTVSPSYTIETVSAYCLGEDLYTFIRLNDNYDVESFRADMSSEQVASNGEGELGPITESSAMVHYVFMVDMSISMRAYKQEVNSFAEALMEQEQQNASYTVATFGTSFLVVQPDMTDKKTVTAELDKLTYNEQWTDPYTGVESALIALDSYSRRSGDLINLIVITDGDPDLGIANAQEEQQKESELAEAVSQKIQQMPEVVVSTFCTAKWDETAQNALGAGKGIHAQATDTQTAAEAGRKMASYTDSLYRVHFRAAQSPAAERFAMTLELRGKDKDGRLAQLVVDMENVPNLKLFSNDSWNDAIDEGAKPQIIDGEDSPGTEEGTGGDPAQATDEGETLAATEDSTEPSGEDDATGGGILWLILLFGAVCVVIVAIICMTVLLRKKKPGGAAAAGQATGIPMKLEVYAGRCPNANATIYLQDYLTIGSAPDCALIFAEPGVAPVHTRIFVRDSIIYIEDLNSQEGTLLGGMRLQGPNRLRSGDIITIGSAEFCLKF